MRDQRSWAPRLPIRPLRGRHAINEDAINEAERLLPTYRGPDASHEGVLFFAGREFGDLTMYTTVIAPDADHGPGRVQCDERAVLEVAQQAHQLGLGVLAQLHSHPGAWTEHSVGDDDMVLMPYEGMLSLVAPYYGLHSLRPLHTLGVHQFQDSRWVACEPRSIRAQLVLVPSSVDLR